jgi:hypothetical protein
MGGIYSDSVPRGSGIQDLAGYIDRILKEMQINGSKQHDNGLLNWMHVYRNDPEMYERLQNVYRHGYSNVLNPDPNMKRWY